MKSWSNLDDRDDYIIRLIEEEKSYSEVGRIVGLSREMIRKIANKRNCKGVYSHAYQEERNEVILEKIKGQKSLKKIAKEYELTPARIAYIANDNGFFFWEEKRNRFLKENKERIEAIKKGASIRSQAVSRQHEVALGRVVRSLGIKSKFRSRWG